MNWEDKSVNKYTMDKSFLYISRIRLIIGLFIVGLVTSLFLDTRTMSWVCISIFYIITFLFLYIWYCVNRYRNYSYYFDNENICMTYGVFLAKTSFMKIETIQYIYSFQSPLQKLFKIRSLFIYSAGNKIHIPHLTDSQINQIKNNIGYNT